MRTVLLTSVVALCLLLRGAEVEARKLFIREIAVAPSCVSVSPEALLALFAQQVPRDVLARRGLEYEDAPSYLALANWNAARFNVRQTANVVRRLQQLDMRYMLWLELSCLPAGGRARYMLTGRLTDLDVMDRILTCPASQAGSRGGRRVCSVGSQVFDAVSYTSVEMAAFEDFGPAVRELLARLLHVPEISVGTDDRTFDPSQEVDVPFLVRRNDGSEPGYSGSPALVRGYRMRQDLVQIPSDIYGEVCRAPALRWNQIACRGGFADGRCDPADRVDYDVRSLVHREVPAQALARVPQDEHGGDRVVFRAPAHEAFYVLRAEAVADEPGGAVRSNPVFACLHVRARNNYLGASARLGFPLWSVSAGGAYPPVAFDLVSFGVDAVLHRYLFSSRGNLFPNQHLVLALGMTYIAGTYPLCAAQGGRCPAEEFSRFHNVIRTSTSWTGELRAQLQSEIIRVGPCAPIALTEFGLGLEHLTSAINPFRNDGWGASYMIALGGGLQCTLGRAGHASTRAWITAEWQVRSRFESRAVPIYVPGSTGALTIFDAAGVPDTLHGVWISVGSTFALFNSSD